MLARCNARRPCNGCIPPAHAQTPRVRKSHAHTHPPPNTHTLPSHTTGCSSRKLSASRAVPFLDARTHTHTRIRRQVRTQTTHTTLLHSWLFFTQIVSLTVFALHLVWIRRRVRATPLSVQTSLMLPLRRLPPHVTHKLPYTRAPSHTYAPMYTPPPPPTQLAILYADSQPHGLRSAPSLDPPTTPGDASQRANLAHAQLDACALRRILRYVRPLHGPGLHFSRLWPVWTL